MKNHFTLVHFGHNIIRLRIEAGLTQVELAQRCQTFSEEIPHIEAGAVNPTLSMIFALSEALGVHPSAILNGIPHGQNFDDEQPTKMTASGTDKSVSSFGNLGTNS
jgi:transcriptional regulator with XRE-family HTH domain